MRVDRLFACLVMAAAGLAIDSAQAQSVKIGYIASFTGASSVNAQDVNDGFKTALAQLGGKLGGIETEFVYGDDQEKPDVARQLADKMVERDKVDIVTGVQLSNVLLAIAKPVTEANVILISPNAGPSQLAGAQCNRNFFAASWQNDNNAEAMGKYLTDQGVKQAYIMAQDFPAGRDKLAGFKRFFKGQIVAEIYTPYTQLDYSAEIAQLRNAKPESLFYFYGGASAISFAKQLDQAGIRSQTKIFGEMASSDQSVLPAIGEAALGIKSAVFWSESFDNPVSQKFVKDYEATYKRIPSVYSAQGYDTAMLIDSAVRKIDGKVKDRAALRKALEAADFKSVRGAFKFNTNHFPIQDWYLAEAVKDSQDRVIMKPAGKILENHQDAYVKLCKM